MPTSASWVLWLQVWATTPGPRHECWNRYEVLIVFYKKLCNSDLFFSLWPKIFFRGWGCGSVAKSAGLNCMKTWVQFLAPHRASMITHPCDLSAQGRGEALRVILGTTLSLRPAWVTQRSCLKEISLPFCCHFVKVTQHWLPLSHRAATSALFLPLSSSRLNFRSDCQAPLKKKNLTAIIKGITPNSEISY